MILLQLFSRKKLSLLLGCLLVMLAGRVGASSVADAPTPPTGDPERPLQFERVTVEDGLSQSSVLCILQDHKGFMWFGTQDGLNKYDGYDITVFKHSPENPQSLSHNHILALHEDTNGIIWIGTDGGGLDRYNRNTGRFDHYQYNPDDPLSLSSNFVNVIYQDSDGVLWVGTDNGLSRYNPAKDTFDHFFHQWDSPNDSLDNDVLTIFEDDENLLWLGTGGGGLRSLDQLTKQVTHYTHTPGVPTSLSHDFVRSIYQDQTGLLWVATDGGGLDRLEPNTGQFTHFRHDPNDPNSLSNDSVISVFQGQDNKLWVATYGGGLNLFDPKTESFSQYRADLNNPHSLSDNFIASFYEDQTGTLWVGTFSGGINRLDTFTERFTHYHAIANQINSLGDNMVWAIYEDSKGIFWIGTNNGLDRFDRQSNQWRHFRHDPDDPSSLSANSIGAILEDSQGVLWVGTAAGSLDRYNPDTRDFVRHQILPANEAGSRSATILDIHEDSAGTLWLASAYGLLKFDRDAKITAVHGLTHHYVRNILEDRDGGLWIGTGYGINYLDTDSGKVRQFYVDPYQSNTPTDNNILSLYQDQSGNLWIGSSGGGLSKFDLSSQQYTRFREKDGLPNNVIYGILEDEQGFLWLSTNRGLSKFDPRNETFVNFDISDGLQSWEFNSGAYAQSSSGEMLFGGVNGFNIFDPADITANPMVPPMVFTALTHNGQDLTGDQSVENIDQIRLVWPANSFEFEYTALNFRQAEKNQYAFKLTNFDDGWNYVGTKRFGRYTNLPGGDYLLQVRGSNNDGVWNKQGVAVKVTVVPPFWASGWFRGSMALLLVGGLWAGYRLRLRNIQARTRELESQVDQRTREIEQRRQELEALYRADAELHRYLSLDEVLQALVDIAVDILQADKSALLVLDEEKDQFTVRAARGYRPESLPQLSFSLPEGMAHNADHATRPLIVEDTQRDARTLAPAVMQTEQIRSLMRVPITVNGALFGMFSADYTQTRGFGGEEIRLFAALAKRAALAIETAQLYEQTQELAVMEERSRLARDLHDAVTQTLFSAGLIAEALPTSWEKDRQKGHDLLRELRQLTRGALAEMRTLLLELRPGGLTDANLGDLLRQLSEAVTGQEGIPVELSITNCNQNLNQAPQLPPDVHIGLYRIAQEALNNVVKHARASKVTVSLQCQAADNGRDAQTVTLRVQDDGRGFDPTTIPAGRLGLQIMQERVHKLVAELTLESQPGAGTRITVVWNQQQGEHNE